MAPLLGAVEELTLSYLRLRDYGGNVHYISNSQITVVTNMSVGFAYAIIDLGVAYGENIDRVTQVLRQVGVEMCQDEGFAAKIFADSLFVISSRFQVFPANSGACRANSCAGPRLRSIPAASRLPSLISN